MGDKLVEKVTITNRLGLHARPAMSFVDLASTFTCDIRVKKGEHEVDGKSIMQMMMLAASQGTQLDIICEGSDSAVAMKALKAMVNAGFDEE